MNEFLAGRGAAIKERNIATDVFDKGPDFDAQSDSLVRVKATEVRKRLAVAYKSGISDRVRIELPVGHYQPVITFEKPPAARPTPALAVPQLPRRSTKKRYFPLAAVCLAALGLFLVVRAVWPSPSSLDLLWGSFIRSGKPVLISLPSPHVISWSTHRLLLLDREAANNADPQADSGGGDFVGVGAAEGAARFGEQLALRQRAFFLKFGGDVSFADLRQYPTILLGAFTSRWTVELTRTLPLEVTGGQEHRIVDTRNPTQFWEASGGGRDGAPRTGYALVGRLLDSESGNAILMAAGIDPHDTQAAVEFLTREEYLSAFTHQVRGWTKKNFQAVIRTSIHGHTPGSPELVTYRTW
ncbi:MAG TPA: hypothetical protein VGL97_11645 [Bryobacteraceae bacterium]